MKQKSNQTDETTNCRSSLSSSVSHFPYSLPSIIQPSVSTDPSCITENSPVLIEDNLNFNSGKRNGPIHNSNASIPPSANQRCLSDSPPPMNQVETNSMTSTNAVDRTLNEQPVFKEIPHQRLESVSNVGPSAPVAQSETTPSECSETMCSISTSSSMNSSNKDPPGDSPNEKKGSKKSRSSSKTKKKSKAKKKSKPSKQTELETVEKKLCKEVDVSTTAEQKKNIICEIIPASDDAQKAIEENSLETAAAVQSIIPAVNVTPTKQSLRSYRSKSCDDAKKSVLSTVKNSSKVGDTLSEAMKSREDLLFGTVTLQLSSENDSESPLAPNLSTPVPPHREPDKKISDQPNKDCGLTLTDDEEAVLSKTISELDEPVHSHEDSWPAPVTNPDVLLEDSMISKLGLQSPLAKASTLSLSLLDKAIDNVPSDRCTIKRKDSEKTATKRKKPLKKRSDLSKLKKKAACEVNPTNYWNSVGSKSTQNMSTTDKASSLRTSLSKSWKDSYNANLKSTTNGENSSNTTIGNRSIGITIASATKASQSMATPVEENLSSESQRKEVTENPHCNLTTDHPDHSSNLETEATGSKEALDNGKSWMKNDSCIVST